MTDDLSNEISRAILIAQITGDDKTNDQDNLYAIRRLFEMFPEYLKSLFSVHGTSLMRMWGYDGEQILKPTPPEERVGNKRVVKTMTIGGRVIKVLIK